MAGLVNGIVIIFDSSQEKLKPVNSIHCKNSRGKFNEGRKVCGIEFLDKNFAMITTNDSRIRFINLKVSILIKLNSRMGKYSLRSRVIGMRATQCQPLCQTISLM